MKEVVARFAAWWVLTFAMSTSALAQATGYSDTVANTNCLANTSCSFTFPAVSSTTNPDAILTVQKVSCRIVSTVSVNTVSGVVYAALGKSANAAKLEFLSAPAYAYGGYVINIIDASALFFVQSGASPIITVLTGTPIVAPNSSVDQPTCTVTGYVE
jgi:hypothetical protein